MMRYQRLSPDCAPLSNGRKSNLRVCKEDENGKTPNYSSPFEGKSNPRHNNNRSGSSPSSSPNQEPNFPSYFPPSSENHESTTTTTTTTSPTRGGGGGDVLLQWGQHKRSRRSRVVTEESSAVVQSRKAIKIHRRVVEKQGILTHAMPPPPPPSSFPLCNTKRSSTTSRDNTTASHLNRNLEERPGPKNGSPSRNGGRVAVSRSALSPDNKAGGGSCSASIREEKANGSMVQVDHQHHNNFESSQLMDQEVGGAGGEKVNMEVFEWPRIYLSLSRKEKEDDFMAMKGTKLPQRPKKRAKNVDKTLQYCFPGMWLSDLTRGRYEVREKKCVKKQKRRGLKGMESMDTDSE